VLKAGALLEVAYALAAVSLARWILILTGRVAYLLGANFESVIFEQIQQFITQAASPLGLGKKLNRFHQRGKSRRSQQHINPASKPPGSMGGI
jgi:hypothetical protein